MFRRGRLLPSAITASGSISRAKKWVLLKYNTYLECNFSSAVDGRFIHVFRANGLYDPDWTGGGHQPFNRDTLLGEYRKYIVTSSFFSVTWMNSYQAFGVSRYGGPFFCVASDTYNEMETNFTANGIDYMIESTDCRQRAYWGDPNNKKTRAYVRWKCPHPFEEAWGAETSSDPTANNQAYFNLIAHPVPLAPIPYITMFRCEIFYRCLFYDPRLVNRSS